MKAIERIFDFLQYQLDTFPKKDMLSYKENGEWKSYATAEVKELIDRLSAGLIHLGVKNNDMTPESQDKIGLASKSEPSFAPFIQPRTPMNWNLFLMMPH